MSLAQALHAQDTQFKDLQTIPGQLGVAVMDYEGHVLTSTGQLLNNPSITTNIYYMLQDVRGILESNNNAHQSSSQHQKQQSTSSLIEEDSQHGSPSPSSSLQDNESTVSPNNKSSAVPNRFHKMEIKFEGVTYLITMTTTHILVVLVASTGNNSQ